MGMTAMGNAHVSRLLRGRRALAAIGTLFWLAVPVVAQPVPGFHPTPAVVDATAAPSSADPQVTQASCAACAGGVLGAPAPDFAGCADGCCSGLCYPGRKPCDCCVDSDSFCGRLFGGIYECICCPDPCYEPAWNVLTDSAFFADGARPMTQMRIGGDFGHDLQFPDRSEYFWAEADGKGKGPQPPATSRGATSLNYAEGSLYIEGAIERVGAFVQMQYLSYDGSSYASASGLADMIVGTKTLLLDCELLLVSFEFKTYIPVGNFTKGLGTGHVSLEPSLLAALKLTPTTYLQGQTSYWFPIAGDSTYQGDVFSYDFSLNQILWHCGHDVQLVGTLELGGYEFLNGSYTVPTPGTTAVVGRARDVGTVVNLGPGLRLNICDKMDFGVGTAFALTSDHLAEDLVRLEARFRF
jgi:hypothetical protein